MWDILGKIWRFEWWFSYPTVNTSLNNVSDLKGEEFADAKPALLFNLFRIFWFLSDKGTESSYSLKQLLFDIYSAIPLLFKPKLLLNLNYYYFSVLNCSPDLSSLIFNGKVFLDGDYKFEGLHDSGFLDFSCKISADRANLALPSCGVVVVSRAFIALLGVLGFIASLIFCSCHWVFSIKSSMFSCELRIMRVSSLGHTLGTLIKFCTSSDSKMFFLA